MVAVVAGVGRVAAVVGVLEEFELQAAARVPKARTATRAAELRQTVRRRSPGVLLPMCIAASLSVGI